MSSSDVDHRNIARSMRKSVENLVVSSQDAIGQSISQALSLSGALSQEIRNVSRSPSPCRISQEPTIIESAEPENVNSDVISSSGLSFASCAESISTSSQADSPQSLSKFDAPVFRTSPPQGRSGDIARAKKKSWYSALYPTYKSRSEDFKKLFKDLPDDERLIVDYSCALQKDILAHGRLYVSQNYLCFHANIFGWETLMSLKLKDVTAITKEKTALVIPNAILICTDTDKHFLASFAGRDKAYLMLFRVWQNALMGQQMNSQEIWQWVHNCYGEELGYNSDDEEYPKELLEEDKLAAVTDSMTEEFLSGNSLTRFCSNDEPRETTRSWGRSISQPGEGTMSNGIEGSAPPSLAPPHSPPTDSSDTTESDGGKSNDGTPTVCQDMHEGTKILDMDLIIDIDQLFTMLFTNSKFCLELLANRKSTDYVQSPWKTNSESGLKCRQVKYTLALSQAVGPKCAYVTETQVMNNCSKPGSMYSIDIDSVNAGIPYADSFYVLAHYCLRKTSRTHTNIKIFANIKYKKNVWGFIKGFIEKNTWAGLEEYSAMLKELLLRETNGDPQAKRKGRRRRRAHSISREEVEHLPHSVLSNGNASSRRSKRKDNFWLYGIIFLLFLINVVLCYKLFYSPVRITDTITPGMSLSDEESAARWRALLATQARVQRGALQVWGRALHRAVVALQQTERTISDLIEEIKPTLLKAQEDSNSSGHSEL